MKNQVTNFKIKGDELYVQHQDNNWYLVTASTFPLKDQTQRPSIENVPIQKGDLGLKIRLSGRLKGVRMARKFEEHVGVGLRTQSLAWAIDEDSRQIFTKWGTIGLFVCRGGGKER